jgi:hypothetical protein
MFFNRCKFFIHPAPITQLNELDDMLKGSSTHSNQSNDGDPDVTWFLSCVNYMSSDACILMYVVYYVINYVMYKYHCEFASKAVLLPFPN